jgi:hypothetical protein
MPSTIKTPIGAPVPAGWKVVRTTRSAQYIQKEAAAPVPQAEMDDLLAAFTSFGIKADVVDDLAAEMGKMGMGGRRRKTARKSRKSRRRV